MKDNLHRIVTTGLLLLLSACFIEASESADTSKVNKYVRTGFKYLKSKGKTVEVKSYIDSALIYCRRNEIKAPVLLNLLRAEYSLAISDYRSASDFASKTIEQAAEEGDIKTQIKGIMFLGYFYFRAGSFQESLDYHEKSLRMAEKEDLKGFIPRIISGQAEVFRALGDNNSYSEYLSRQIKAAKRENDSSYLTSGLYLLGTLHAERLRNFRLCDSLLRESYRISSLRGDISHMSLSQANLGWNFYLEKMYDSSAVCYNRSLKLSVPAKLYSVAANAYGNLGNIYRDLGKPARSLEYYNKSLDLAAKVNDIYHMQWVYKDISDLYLNLDDTANAFVSFVEHKKYSDQYLKKSNAQGLSDAQFRYEADSHRKEVELLSLKLKNQKILIYGFSGLAVLAVAVLFLLYRGSKLRARRHISEMGRKISELTQANLRQQMNPHFIFNTLNSIQYYMYQHDRLATNNYLTKFTSLMRKVLENSQHTSVLIRDELEALNLYLELESLRFKDRFDYRITVDEEIDQMLFKIPTMLIQPYVENSICHGMIPGETKGMISIELRLGQDHINCIIEDNGIGREAAMKRKEKLGGNHNSLGTRIVSSRLDLVNSLYGTSLKTIYTDLKDEQGEPAGTKVEIHIPIIS